MTFFHDTFVKTKKESLSYDDSAFLFFAATIVLVVLLVWAIYFIRYLYLPLDYDLGNTLSLLVYNKKNRCVSCCCESCKQKISLHYKKFTSWTGKLCRKPFYFHFFCLLFLSFILKMLLTQINGVSQIRAFQPYEILNISQGVSEQEIRKAYRRMSLIHHPDRHPTDPLASAKFILITKAYQALSDPVARSNYEKYGNPDGPEVLQIGIGLPQFLVKEDHQLLVLAIFMLILLVGIPLAFILYYHHQKNLYSNGLRLETIQIIGLYLTEGTRFKKVVELFAASVDIRYLSKITSEDRKAIEKISTVLQEKVDKSQFHCPIIDRLMILLYGHMERLHGLMTPHLLHDLHILLQFLPAITETMVEVAFLRNWYRVIRSIFTFRRCVIHAFLPSSSVLMQLPHYACFSPEIKKKYTGNLSQLIKDVLSTDVTKSASTLFSPLPSDRLADLKSFCKALSRVSLNVEVFVEGESEIVENDLVTFHVTLRRDNLEWDQQNGLVHAPYCKDLFFEKWWILIMDKKDEGLFAKEPCTFKGKSATSTLQAMIPYAGDWTFRVVAICDSYMGLDQAKQVVLKVYSKDQVVRRVRQEVESEEGKCLGGLLESFFGVQATNESSLTSDTEDL